MPNLVPGYGPQGFEPSGGPQVMGPQEKLADMARLMQGAPNSVLMMIARILGSGQQPQQQWQQLHPMPPPPIPRFGGVNGAMPMRPTEPGQIPTMVPNPGFIRG